MCVFFTERKRLVIALALRFLPRPLLYPSHNQFSHKVVTNRARVLISSHNRHRVTKTCVKASVSLPHFYLQVMQSSTGKADSSTDDEKDHYRRILHTQSAGCNASGTSPKTIFTNTPLRCATCGIRLTQNSFSCR